MNKFCTHAIRLLALLSILLTLPLQAATNHALIVGVSEYPELAEELQLVGPKNDAILVREFLTTYPHADFKDENIHILADGVEGAELPTRTAIMDAAGKIANMAGPGDFVYLHFSGHGSRAPALKDKSETDGLDELFLPRDVRKWNDSIGRVENALIDDELGKMIADIRNRGAFVWAVFDSCHSGTVTRGAAPDDEVRMRKVDSVRGLGIPQHVIDEAGAMQPRSRGIAERMMPSDIIDESMAMAAGEPGMMRGKPGDNATPDANEGGFVAFYAAQTTEQTPEERLPAGQPGRQSQGVFTFTLLQVLNEYPTASYRQAAAEVIQRYAIQRRSSPTPLFEGDLDTRVFGAEAADVIPQWPVRKTGGKLQLDAGSLNEVSKGSILAVLASPAAQTEEAIGYVEVVANKLNSSTLKSIAYKDKAVLANNDFPQNAYGRLVTKAVDFTLTVARPAYSTSVKDNERKRLDSILESVATSPENGLRVVWVEPGSPADVRLAFGVENPAKAAAPDDANLWLLPPSGEIVFDGERKSPSITTSDKDDAGIRAALTENLRKIARVTNLLRLTRLGGAGKGMVDYRLRIERTANGEMEDAGISDVPAVNPGDVVYISATNQSSHPVDLNVLYIGSDYSIGFMLKARIEENGRLPDTAIVELTDESFGLEQVIVIASEGKKGELAADFSFLEQDALPKTRGQGKGGLDDLLAEASFGKTTTRGGKPPQRKGGFSIQPFQLNVTAE